MSADLPTPLVAAAVDLRGYGFMPLYGNHLFGSEFNTRVSDAGWRAGLTLWWAAWNQVPAASLPSDDAGLCRLADLGRDLRAWKKIKLEALHGFVQCSDGRLYHPFLAGLALEAWERRLKERARKAKFRENRPRSDDGDRTSLRPSQEPGRDADSGWDGTADNTTQGQGEGQGELKETTPPQPVAAREASTSPAVAVIAALDAAIVEHFGAHRARPWPTAMDDTAARRYLDAGAQIDQLAALFGVTCKRLAGEGQEPPGSLNFFEKAVKRMIADAAKPLGVAPAGGPAEPMYFDQVRERWLAECRNWERSSRTKWRGDGLPPDHPNTLVPKAIRAELGIVTRQEDAA